MIGVLMQKQIPDDLNIAKISKGGRFMELKRSIYKELTKWKSKKTGRVLNLEGARQVGKTYILNKFASENFKHMVYINMAEASGEDFLKCLARAEEWEPGTARPQNSLHEALTLYDIDFNDNEDTIIIIDEIQESVLVFNRLRSFARDFECFVVVTGSYLGKTLQKDYFLPAGDIDYMTMETLSFEEFLDVFDLGELYRDIELFGESPHEDYDKLKGYYDVYQRIGGYPSVVKTYAATNDLNECESELKNLLTIFINESKRYFDEIVDIDIFEKLFNGIALLMLKEKTGVRDLVSELSKIVYQSESGRITKKMINHVLSWLQASHIIGYAGKSIDCDIYQVKENCRYYFLDMGLAYRFLKSTGASFNNMKGTLAENFVYIALRHHIDRDIAGNTPWFALYEKTKGELDFYVRSLVDYKDYGIEVKSTDEAANTARALYNDKKLNYLYYLKGDSYGGKADENKILTVPLCLADRITFDLGSRQDWKVLS